MLSQICLANFVEKVRVEFLDFSPSQQELPGNSDSTSKLDKRSSILRLEV